MKRQYNIGDKVIVIRNTCGHGIPLGTHVTIDGYFSIYSYTVDGWALSPYDIVRNPKYLKLKVI